MIQVLPSLTAVVGDLVDLTDDLTQLCSGTQVVLTTDQDLALHIFTDLHGSQALLSLDCPGDQGTGLHLNAHQFQHIQSFKGTPTAIELKKILSHLGDACFQTGTRTVLRQLPIEIP